MESKQQNTFLSVAQPFIHGGIAGMVATTVIQPIDMIKVRIQLAGESSPSRTRVSPFRIANQVIQQESFFGLYRGLSAGLLRQATYTTARMGFFNQFMNVK